MKKTILLIIMLLVGFLRLLQYYKIITFTKNY